MKTKEFKDIISQSTAKGNSLILNAIEYPCAPFNSWFETHSRLKIKSTENQPVIWLFFSFCVVKHIVDFKNRPHF